MVAARSPFLPSGPSPLSPSFCSLPPSDARERGSRVGSDVPRVVCRSFAPLAVVLLVLLTIVDQLEQTDNMPLKITATNDAGYPFFTLRSYQLVLVSPSSPLRIISRAFMYTFVLLFLCMTSRSQRNEVSCQGTLRRRGIFHFSVASIKTQSRCDSSRLFTFLSYI